MGGSFSAVICCGAASTELPPSLIVGDSTEATLSREDEMVDGVARGLVSEEGTKADDDTPKRKTAAKAAGLNCTILLQVPLCSL